MSYLLSMGWIAPRSYATLQGLTQRKTSEIVGGLLLSTVTGGQFKQNWPVNLQNTEKSFPSLLCLSFCIVFRCKAVQNISTNIWSLGERTGLGPVYKERVTLASGLTLAITRFLVFSSSCLQGS